MQLGHTIDFMATNRGKISHPDISFTALINQRHSGDARSVVGKFKAHVIKETTIDLVNNLEVPGQEATKQADRPLFQSFR